MWLCPPCKSVLAMKALVSKSMATWAHWDTSSEAESTVETKSEDKASQPQPRDVFRHLILHSSERIFPPAAGAEGAHSVCPSTSTLPPTIACGAGALEAAAA